jgi:hypothetical protein
MGLARIGYEPAHAGMRRRFGAFSVVGATLAALALGFGVLGVAGAAPSNQGTIKIFDGDKELPANDPKAGCDFTVRGIEFEANEQGIVVTIEGQGGPNVAGPGSFAQTVNADANGDWSTSNIHNFPEGMYKANANDGEGGGDKNKVFRVECAPVTPPTQPPQTSPPGEEAAPPPPGAAAPPAGPAAAPPAPPAARAPAPAAPAPPAAAAVAAPPRGVTG